MGIRCIAKQKASLKQRFLGNDTICEVPGDFYLRSCDYDLPRSLYQELNPEEQSLIISSIRRRIEESNPFIVYGPDLLGAGEVRRTRSELALVAEFLMVFILITENSLSTQPVVTVSNRPCRPSPPTHINGDRRQGGNFLPASCESEHAHRLS